ncbi:MAG: class I SAM-dependent methyltransferase [Abitibacteriaceae bacterium]|nr:class I SAM-dependent methyltransferase [Abditibacteriaceae bacterium]
MDQEAYYFKNAELHNQEGPISPVLTTKQLPVSPGEIDWAVFWLLHAYKRGACLDVGCAQLSFLRSVADMFDRRCGVDIAACANWPDHPEIETQICNLDKEPLNFPDQSFDAVTMLMVLEHVFNPFHAVRELRRVCKPDGLIVIAVPNIASLRHRITLLMGRLPITSARFSFLEEAWDGYHLHNFTRSSLTWLLRREGLKPLRWASAGSLQTLKRRRPQLFGGDLIVLCRPTEPVANLPLSF